MIQNQWEGRPVEYKKADNGSDPVQAVDKARQLVESDKIQYMAGPIFSPSAAAVTDYLAKAGGIPQCSIVGQPSDNLKTANDLAFMPNGLYGSQGYYFGKYVGEELGYKTVNCINLEDTAARQLQAGFEKGFGESGGKVLSTPVRADRHHRLQLVPHDAQGRRRHLLLGVRQRRRAVRQAVQRLRPHRAADRADVQQLQRAAARRPRRSSASAWSPATSTARRSTTRPTRRSSPRTRSCTRASTPRRRRTAATRRSSSSCRASRPAAATPRRRRSSRPCRRSR